MSGVITAIGVSTAIGAGASIYASEQQSSAIEGATEAQTAATGRSLRYQQKTRNENKAILADARDKAIQSLRYGGAMAAGQIAPLAGLEPLEQYKEMIQAGPGAFTPQQEREFGRGVQAMQAGFSRTSGGGISSRALENAQIYGQDFEARRLDEQLNRLIPLINIAVGARQNLAGITTGLGKDVAQTQLGAAQAVAGLPSEGIARSMADIGNIKAAGQINQANVNTQLLSNLTGIGSNLANVAIQNPQLFSSIGGNRIQPTEGAFGAGIGPSGVRTLK